MAASWKSSNNCYWCEWDTSDTEYEYAVRLAVGNPNSSWDRTPLFRIIDGLPNVNSPSGYSELVVVNGSIFDTDSGYVVGGWAYNTGGHCTTYSYSGKQSNWGTTPPDYSYLSMYSEGNGTMNFTTTSNVDAGYYPITLGCTARADGTGEPGTYDASSHSFIGRCGTKNFAGYSLYITGARTVSVLKSYYGSSTTCAVLDGGGSTFCRYQGTEKRSSTRPIHNAIAIYYKKKEVTPSYTISVNASPSAGGSVSGGGTYTSGSVITLTATANSGYYFSKWSNGSTSSSINVTVTSSTTYTAYFTKESPTGIIDTRRIGNYAVGLTYILKDGSLHQAQPWYSLHNGVLRTRPRAITQLQNGSLVYLILKNTVQFDSAGGSDVADKDFYSLIESIDSFKTPTHANYDGRAVTFDGWYSDTSYNQKIIGVSSSAAGDRTYYAKWIQTKTQYRGYYETSSTSTQSIPGDSYSGSASPVYFRAGSSSPITHSSSIKVTSLFANFDNCYSDWTGYVKPQVDYGYFTGGEGSSYYTHIGTLYSSGEDPSTKSVSFTLPSGSSVGFRVYRNGTRTLIYLYDGGSYKYGGTSKTWVDWQDSSSPPSGSWASGYPETRTVTRYYNGYTKTWSDWE